MTNIEGGTSTFQFPCSAYAKSLLILRVLAPLQDQATWSIILATYSFIDVLHSRPYPQTFIQKDKFGPCLMTIVLPSTFPPKTWKVFSEKQNLAQ